MQYDAVTHDDLEQIAVLQPDGWPDIRKDFKFYINNNFCNPIKVTVDHTIVGVGSSMVFKNTAWLAHIIVGDGYRNRGIGTRLVDRLLSDLKRMPIHSILLIATELGEPLYKKSGFRFITDYIYLNRKESWNETPFSAHVVPFTKEYYGDVISLDRRVSGEDREALISMFLERGLIYSERHKLTGFYLPDLGEGLIFADNPKAGTELMKIKYSGVDKAVLPSGNPDAIDFLKRNGFSESDTTGKRMLLGREVDWKPGCFYGRTGGNFG